MNDATTNQSDVGQSSRFGVAAVLSCIVNVLFLIGASVLITPPPDYPSGSEHPLYITLVDAGTAITTSRPISTPTQQLLHTIEAPSHFPLPTLAPIQHERSPQKPLPVAPSRSVARPHTSSKPLSVAAAPAVALTAISSLKAISTLPLQKEDAPSTQSVSQPATAREEGSGYTSVGKGEAGGTNSPDDSGTATAPPTTSEAAPGSSTTPSTPASNGQADSRPSGPTRDAQITSQVLPEIPSHLNEPNLKTFVRVKIEIDPDGNFVPTLSTSSGNPQIDVLVLNALKRWRWKPALKDGQPVASTQTFRFDLEIQ